MIVLLYLALRLLPIVIVSVAVVLIVNGIMHAQVRESQKHAVEKTKFDSNRCLTRYLNLDQYMSGNSCLTLAYDESSTEICVWIAYPGHNDFYNIPIDDWITQTTDSKYSTKTTRHYMSAPIGGGLRYGESWSSKDVKYEYAHLVLSFRNHESIICDLNYYNKDWQHIVFEIRDYISQIKKSPNYIEKHSVNSISSSIRKNCSVCGKPSVVLAKINPGKYIIKSNLYYFCEGHYKTADQLYSVTIIKSFDARFPVNPVNHDSEF